jgi:hypothetical protein
MLLHIRKQQLEGATMMIMRHGPPRDAPEPFNAIGVRIIGRSIQRGIVNLARIAERIAQNVRKSGGSAHVF